MKVTIDHDGCISCGLCVSTCPEVFQFAEDGKATVKAQPSGSEQEACSDQAAVGCPVSVISTE